MTEIWKHLITYVITMLAITNPIGNMAIFIGLTANKSVAEQRMTAMMTGFASAVIFLLVTWLGEALLHFMGISISSFEIAGGLVILLLGLSMLKTDKSAMSHTAEEQESAEHKDSIAVVPMAIPIIAGPGAITTILVSLQHYPHVLAKVVLSFTNLCIALVIGVVLCFASVFSRWLGVSGIKIATRIMGLILMAMAVGMIISGLGDVFPGWLS